ncbi:MAG: hypothetical protein U5L96_16305 [Owenweeksia sp.]|nr:hypothetical protein [Owenweeksia sp.]
MRRTVRTVLAKQHKYSYLLIDSALYIGEIFYKVTRLTKDSLTLNRKEKWTNTDEDLILTRSRKTIEPNSVKEQKIRTVYPSGQIRLSGLKLNGFRHGIWTEWYKNGRVKSVIRYQMDDLFMKIEFD